MFLYRYFSFQACHSRAKDALMVHFSYFASLSSHCLDTAPINAKQFGEFDLKKTQFPPHEKGGIRAYPVNLELEEGLAATNWCHALKEVQSKDDEMVRIKPRELNTFCTNFSTLLAVLCNNVWAIFRHVYNELYVFICVNHFCSCLIYNYSTNQPCSCFFHHCCNNSSFVG
jgi:hypothetical protein